METQEYISDEVLDTFVKENYGDRTFNGGSWYDLYCFPGWGGCDLSGREKGSAPPCDRRGAMEQIIDASLSSFGNPARHLLGMVTLENNEFMTVLQMRVWFVTSTTRQCPRYRMRRCGHTA